MPVALTENVAFALSQIEDAIGDALMTGPVPTVRIAATLMRLPVSSLTRHAYAAASNDVTPEIDNISVVAPETIEPPPVGPSPSAIPPLCH